MPSSISSSDAPPPEGAAAPSRAYGGDVRSGRAKVRLAALIACVLAMVALGLAAWQAMPLSPVSSQRYLAAVEDHVDMLARTKGEKGRIVLMGGSGAAFSISADQLTDELGRPVYNGGLQAGIGLRNLVNLYAPQLDPANDLVVLLPEPEMLADDALYSQTWCDVLFLTKDMSGLARQMRCIPNVLWRTWQEGRHHLNDAMGESASTDPVYRRSGFNARGDLVSHLGIERPAPDFSGYDHPDIPSEKLGAIISHVQETLSKQGVEVLYVPAAMPLAGCEKSPERVAAMAAELATLTARRPDTPDIEPFCLASELFFDGAGHLNERGRIIQTRNVAQAVARYFDATKARAAGQESRPAQPAAAPR